ncbi:FAD-dependent thymidylate synthase [Candidatus Parcubacteria bacterium]|nr:FAD-dependent thymidylate synthase [Candidatus Parcubacteria bacterium]
MANFTNEEVRLLSEFVSDPRGNVFAVFPHKMPGMIGAAYARYSRARGGLRETLLKEFIRAGVLDARHADELIQRILIVYGDDSVQELESAWLSLEGISNLATKVVEDRRLGGYIEQSSRYVFYDQRDEQGRFRYLREPTIMASPYGARYEAVMDAVFGTYCWLIEPMQEYFRRRKPLEAAEYEIRADRGKMRYADCRDDQERNDFKTTWRFDIRAKACDTIRILLPASTLTNVGMHANGRTFEHMLRHLYSSDLLEMQQLAVQAHAALNTVIPRYVERARRSEYLVETRRAMQVLADALLDRVTPEPAAAVTVTEGSYEWTRQLAAMLYPYSEHSLEQLTQFTRWDISPEQQWRIYDTYIGNRRTRRDRPGRALEFGYPWFVDLVIDFGIYRDLHRHRMLTQQRQRITTRLGFCEIPEAIVEAGFRSDVEACAEQSAELYEAVRVDLGSEVAQYCALFGHNIRCCFAFNDREAQHLLELRTGPQGHQGYRRICQEIYRQMRVVDPVGPLRVERFMKFVDLNDYDWPRADSEARQRAKEAKLGSE